VGAPAEPAPTPPAIPPPTPATPPPTPPTALPQRHAGLVSRLAALVVDVGLLTVGGLAISVLPSLAWDQVIGDSPGWLAAGSAIASALLPWAYFTASWALAGETVGDLLLGLVVRRRDGQRLSLVHAGLQAFVGLLFAPVWLIGMLAVLWDDQRRAWHDRLFRTVVNYSPSARRNGQTATRRSVADGS